VRRGGKRREEELLLKDEEVKGEGCDNVSCCSF
jgi:hypothetical protein